MIGTLDQILADWRGDAAVLRRHGNEHDAELIEKLCHQVSRAAEDYLQWLSEEDAMLQSGHGGEWFRGRFAGWERDGHARRIGRKRYYRQVVVPRRANPEAAREAGRQAGAT